MSELPQMVVHALTIDCGTGVPTRAFATDENRAALREIIFNTEIPMTTRDRAIYLMGLWPDDNTVSTILLVIQDIDEEGRLAAASALGRIHTAAAVAALGQLVKDRAPDVRRVAINSLGRIGTPAAAEQLRQVASSEESDLNRARAREFLKRMP